MKGKALKFENFVIHPEYCGHNLDWLVKGSKRDNNFHVASISHRDENVAVVLQEGKTLYLRPKYRLHPSERGTRGSRVPGGIRLDGKRVLILICYEILFPEDYLMQSVAGTDLVIHMVGEPMYSEAQKEGWVAFHKALSLLHNCPVACCCGGLPGPMNISGVTYSYSPGFEKG